MTLKIKTVMMTFASGLIKEVKEGDPIFITHRHRSNNDINATITKIGSKFITTSRGSKFFIDSGLEQSEYCRGSVFSNKEEYEELKMNEEKNSKFKTIVREAYSKKWSNEQLDQAMAILEISLN